MTPGRRSRETTSNSLASVHLLAEFFGGMKIGLQQVPIYLHRRGVAGLNVEVHIHMAAMNFFAHDLAQTQLVDSKPSGKRNLMSRNRWLTLLTLMRMDQPPGFGSGLRVAGHGDGIRLFSFGAVWFLSGRVLGS